MNGMAYFCCSEQRRVALEAHPELNGIDYLEVADLLPADLDAAESAQYTALPPKQRSAMLWNRKLTLYFVNPLLAAHLAVLKRDNFRIDGGEKIRHVGVSLLSSGSNFVVLKAGQRGDFSPYRLRLVKAPDDANPPQVFEPLQAAVDFSFRIECLDDFDCATQKTCPPEIKAQIDLDYLARDYASFRRLMLDRISTLSPGWKEKSPADLGMALVETLAYVADYLSYRQDAVATEAYLGTARRRTSVRRHARLVDYFMHDGCNARAWVQVVLDSAAPASGIALPRVDAGSGASTKFLTRANADTVLGEAEFARIRTAQHPEVFEPLHDMMLYPEHNALEFYTWGGTRCCLPKGATRATLLGHFNHLKPGAVLIFQEVRGPHTGVAEDADPAHRHAVQLTEVAQAQDPLGGRFLDPPSKNPVGVCEIAWGEADALPFPLCLSSLGDDGHDKQPVSRISIALGNIVLADHGCSVSEKIAQTVPAAALWHAAQTSACCVAAPRTAIAPRYRPALVQRPVTQAAPYDKASSASAAAAMHWNLREVLPALRLEGSSGATSLPWSPVRDLLQSNANARDFVVEVEEDLAATLRFGDDAHGQRPAPGTAFSACYRVGNGQGGNIGAGSLAHVVTRAAGIVRVWNPLPARGGQEPESMEDVRRFAPAAFRTQQRAVTGADYAMQAQTHPQIQKAAATFRWTGSWRTVFVTPDPMDRKEPGQPLAPDLRAYLEPCRMAGHDLEIDTPRYVPLEIEMQICARPDYFRSDVARALQEIFSARMLPDGSRGVFHADNFSFGQAVYLSRLYAAAYAVAGVASVRVVTFRRQGVPDPQPLLDGKLVFDRLEIARLDNDRNFPERGLFKFTVAGGK